MVEPRSAVSKAMPKPQFPGNISLRSLNHRTVSAIVMNKFPVGLKLLIDYKESFRKAISLKFSTKP